MLTRATLISRKMSSFWNNCSPPGLRRYRPRWFLKNMPDLSRSEEHTSELQSLMRISYAVFCLKKKKILTSKHRTGSDKKNKNKRENNNKQKQEIYKRTKTK